MDQEVVLRIQLAEEFEQLIDMLRRRRDLVVTGDMNVVKPEPQMSALVIRSKLGKRVVRIEKADDARRLVALDHLFDCESGHTRIMSSFYTATVLYRPGSACAFARRARLHCDARIGTRRATRHDSPPDRRSAVNRSAQVIALVATYLAMTGWAFAQAAAPTAPSGTIRGTVLDRAGGTPIADVSVRIQDAAQAVTTDAAGRFELRDVSPGTRTVVVSIVGFILVRRTVQVESGQAVELTVVLSEGTGTYSENVVVTAGRFPERERAVPAQLVLGSADIQNLRSLVTNDPMRTVHVLPGVSAGDDFRSEFAVRASPFSQIGFTVDGVSAPFLLHTVQQVQDGGSITMVNGDILDGIALMNGAIRSGSAIASARSWSSRSARARGTAGRHAPA